MLRLDDLEGLGIMAVQLDEARAFLVQGTVSHARLAFILLDNAPCGPAAHRLADDQRGQILS